MKARDFGQQFDGLFNLIKEKFSIFYNKMQRMSKYQEFLKEKIEDSTGQKAKYDALMKERNELEAKCKIFI